MAPPATEATVSVVVPCWNAERFVRRAIDSALAQTHPKVEVVAVDDGSTDATGDILRQYGERIRLLSGPNRGLSCARNVGIFAASGEYIVFLDADDELYPTYVRSALPIAEQAGPKTIVASPGEIELIGGEVRPMPCDHVCQRDPLLGFLAGRPVQIAAYLFRKSDLVSVGGFNDGYCEDFDLCARFCARGYRFVAGPATAFRIHQVPGSMSSIGFGFLRHRPKAYARLVATASEHGTWTEQRAEMLAWKMLSDAEILLSRGDREEAVENIRAAKRLSPAAAGRFLDDKKRAWHVLFKLFGVRMGMELSLLGRRLWHSSLGRTATARHALGA